MENLEKKYELAYEIKNSHDADCVDQITGELTFEAWDEVLIQAYEIKEEHARIYKISLAKAHAASKKYLAEAERYLEDAFHEGFLWEKYLRTFHKNLKKLKITGIPSF